MTYSVETQFSGDLAADTKIAVPGHPQNLRVVFVVAKRLWFFYVVIFLTVTSFAIVGPLFQYVILSFFASGHGGGDCMVAPSSKSCRLAAGDLTTYNGIVGSVTSAVAVVSALTLGSLSDSTGRRLIFIIKGLLTTGMLFALALHVLAGLTLWIFLVIKPLAAMWDFNGVSMALMADVVPEREMRGAAMSITIALVLIVVLACTILAGLLPVSVSFSVALIAATLKLVFYLAVFPETAKLAPSSESSERRGPLGALRAARQIIGSNDFILRVACIAVIGAVSSVGSGLVIQPYLTSYIGMDHKQLAGLFSVGIVSVLFTLGVLAKPLTACCGDVRTYQFCLFAVAVFPACLCLCAEASHVVLVVGLLMGPMFLQIPIVSALKSNLVSDEEQGLVQGALASLCNLASALAAPIFSWMTNYCTQGGAVEARSAAFPPLLTASAVGMAAFLVSLTLPLTIPISCTSASQALLKDERCPQDKSFP